MSEGKQGRQGIRGFEGVQGVQGQRGLMGEGGSRGPQGAPGNPGRGLVALFLTLVLIAGMLAWAVGDHVAHSVVEDSENRIETTERRLFTQVCHRNNIAKATIRTNMRRGLPQGVGSPENMKRNDLLNPILNCDATFEGDRLLHPKGVVLPPAVEDEYLRLIDDGWIPELKGDKITGKHRAETGENADY